MGRFVAYTTGGALAGGFSSNLLSFASTGAQVFQALNWMMMAVLVFSSVLLLWRGQTVGMLVQERVVLPPALQQRLGPIQNPGFAHALKAGLLWLFMPCGVLWAGLVLAYLGGSVFQGAVLMAVFAAASGAGLQLVSSLRQALSSHVGERFMLRASGAIVLFGIAIMLGRQVGLVPTPAWLGGIGLCL